MKKKTAESVTLDAEGYQVSPHDLNGEALPNWRRLAGQPKLSLAQAEKASRGGRRAGAGRKPLGKVRKQVKLSPSAVHRLTRYANRRKLTFSDALERMVLQASIK